MNGRYARMPVTARWSIAAAAAAALALVVAPVATGATPADAGGSVLAPPSSPFPVIASGLDNPRGIAIASNGDIFVAESGHGGAGACIPSADDPTVDACFGLTGAITRIRDGHASQVVTGLPSVAAQIATQGGQLPPGAEASGPSDVAVIDADHVAFTIGLGSNPANRDSTLVPADPTAALMGTLVSSTIPGDASTTTSIADIAAFEAANDPVPAPTGPDSNANSVIVDGTGYAVVDAGGNDLLGIDADGNVSMMATFPSAEQCPPPPVTPQAVPTAVTRGPDGALYVSELTGFPFCEGGASIFKIDHGSAVVYASGLTNVTGLAFGPDGTLYAVEIAQHGLLKGPIGALVAIPAGGGTSLADYRMVAAGLFAPYGIAISDASAYVTTGSVLPATAGGGSVVKIPLDATVPTSAPVSAPTSASVAPTSTFEILPGGTGDAGSAAPSGDRLAWGLLGLVVLLCGATVVVWMRRRRTESRHA